MTEIVLVRRESPGDEDALAAIRDAVATLAGTVGAFAFSHGEEVSADANHYLWFGPRSGDEVAVIDDFAVPVRYVAVRAPSETRAAQVAEALARTLDHVPLTELRSLATEGADPAAITRLALALSQHDAETEAIVARALASPADATRYHGVVAASLLGWPQLLPALETMAKAETNDGLRRLADHAVRVASSPRAP
jgi:hypothetical protein